MTDQYRAINVAGRLPPVVYFRFWEKERERVDALIHLIGPDLPIYEIGAPADASGLSTVDRWAAAVRRTLADLPIGPPYRFMGWSFAGVVALELAQQLQRDGIAVEH